MSNWGGGGGGRGGDRVPERVPITNMRWSTYPFTVFKASRITTVDDVNECEGILKVLDQHSVQDFRLPKPRTVNNAHSLLLRK